MCAQELLRLTGVLQEATVDGWCLGPLSRAGKGEGLTHNVCLVRKFKSCKAFWAQFGFKPLFLELSGADAHLCFDSGGGKPCHSQCICWAFSRLGIAGNGPSPRIHFGEKPFCNQRVLGVSAASLCFRARCRLGLERAGATAARLAAGCWASPWLGLNVPAHHLRVVSWPKAPLARALRSLAGTAALSRSSASEPVLLSWQHKGKPLLEEWGL